jgi:hypothetical protein
VSDNPFLVDLEEISSFLPRSDRVVIPKSAPTNDIEFLASPSTVTLALQLIQAYTARINDALNLYLPLPGAASAFHASNARIRLVSGSNQAGKAQGITEPVLTTNGFRKIGDLRIGDQVIGGDGRPCNVTGVFPQGELDIFRLTFDDGASARCSEDHLWRVALGCNRFGRNRRKEKWEVKTLKELRAFGGDSPVPLKRAAIETAVAHIDKQDVPLDPYVVGALLGDGSICHRQIRLSSADDELLELVRDRLPLGCDIKFSSKYDYYITHSGDNPVRRVLDALGLTGKRAWEKSIPSIYLNNSIENRLAVLRGLMDTDGGVGKKRRSSNGDTFGGTIEYCTTSPQLAKDVEFLVRSLGGKCKTSWRVTHYTYKGERKAGRPSARMRIRIETFNPFLLKRKADLWVAPKSTANHRILHKIEPAGREECVCISVDSPDHTYITNDFIVTHNTLAAEAEFARLCRGKDPYNKRAKGNQKTLAVGKDLAHIGQVMWRKLHWTGAFEIVRDEITGLWRSVRPDPNNIQTVDPIDLARKHLWMPSPPMVPFSDIANMAWESKGEGIPSVVHLKNGTEMMFRTSNGKPPNGIQIDVIHFDEEITNPDWYPEMIPRLVRKGGIFYWSATPQSQTPQFYGLHRDCMNGDPDVAEFSLLIADNPYFAPEDKEAMRRRLLAYGDGEYEVRWLGKYAIQGRAVYPTYDTNQHGVDLAVVPDDWMRIVVVDPGSKVAAFLIMAVPPSANCLYVTDECEVHNQDAEAIAKEIKKRLNGRTPEAYVFDKRAGVQHSIGRNDRVADHYAKAFKKVGCPPAIINPGFFVYGCDIPAAREMSVKNMLNTGKLKFIKERTSKLDLQIKNRYYDKNNPDKRESRTTHDLCDDLEYGCAFFDERGLYYNPPPAPKPQVSKYDQSVIDSLKAKKRKGWKLV